MKLFGYITVFADNVRDIERTIWHHACWGRGGPQCEAHARWGKGGLAVVAPHYCGPVGGRGGPSPIGPRYHGLARGRGGSNPAARPPYHSSARGRSLVGPHYHCPTDGRGGPSPAAPPVAVPPEGRGCLVVTVNDKGPDDEGLIPPLVSSSPFFFFSKMEEILLALSFS
jgi:hypothetical protein